ARQEQEPATGFEAACGLEEGRAVSAVEGQPEGMGSILVEVEQGDGAGGAGAEAERGAGAPAGAVGQDRRGGVRAVVGRAAGAAGEGGEDGAAEGCGEARVQV